MGVNGVNGHVFFPERCGQFGLVFAATNSPLFPGITSFFGWGTMVPLHF
jgi:hypothetical protein